MNANPSPWVSDSSLNLEGPATSFIGVDNRVRVNGAVAARSFGTEVEVIGLKEASRSADSEVNAEGGTVRTAYLKSMSLRGDEALDVKGR